MNDKKLANLKIYALRFQDNKLTRKEGGCEPEQRKKVQSKSAAKEFNLERCH